MSARRPERRIEATARDRLILVAFTVVLVGVGIGLRDPWPSDEPRFLLIAQQMLASGDWLIPQRGIEPYSHKPPLFFWVEALYSPAMDGTGDERHASQAPLRAPARWRRV